MRNKNPINHVKALVKRNPKLKACEKEISDAFKLLKQSFEKGGKLLIAGNGGSCADAEHIAGELMKGFMKSRCVDNEFEQKLVGVDKKIGSQIAEKIQKGLPSIVLSNHQSLNTAFVNDVNDGGAFLYAQQVNVYGQNKDVFLGISTSGNSQNVLNAAVTAKAKGMKVIGLTGQDGGKLAKFCDVVIKAPEKQTHLVQELHLPIYHCLCLMVEDYFFE